MREFARRDRCDKTIVQRAIQDGRLKLINEKLDAAMVGTGWRETNRRVPPTAAPTNCPAPPPAAPAPTTAPDSAPGNHRRSRRVRRRGRAYARGEPEHGSRRGGAAFLGCEAGCRHDRRRRKSAAAWCWSRM